MTMIIITLYLSLRPTKEALDSLASVPVIPVRNSDEGESLRQLSLPLKFSHISIVNISRKNKKKEKKEDFTKPGQ